MSARQRVESEFDEPLRDVLTGMRDQGCTWDEIAGALGVSRWQVWLWREELGIEDERRFYRKRNSKINRAARRLGYENAKQAVRDMRWSGLTVEQVAARLGVCERTVRRNYPPGLAGEIYVRTEKWWRTRFKPGGNWSCMKRSSSKPN